PRFAPTDLHALIRKSLGLLSGQAEKKRIRFDAVLEAVNPEVAVDAEQCTQVMLNLLLNGIQILAEGGRIRVSTRDSAEEFTIDIADDGPGIPPAERSRVFEAFFFRREGGMGLGLAIVQQIVAAHGGSIEAGDSELGGALFRIRLPRRSEES
ncbi:two-component sensor histidine kinase, partial [Azoarcus sp. TTM-91]|uniref:sensor histidine kinase n=1 Tax=Azoarcus sp. TTM-91 TaxID=2691581 RepID=UPI0016985768